MSEELSIAAIDIPFVKTTRRSQNPEDFVDEVVELSRDDLVTLQGSGPSRAQPKVTHLRAYHQLAALKLATGDKEGVVARSLGVTPQVVTKLKADPQFNSLVESYREKLVEKAIDMTEIMTAVSFEALARLHEKLLDEGESSDLSPEALRRIAETFVDRIGHSPVRRSETTTNLRHSIQQETLQRIKDLHSEDNIYTPEAAEQSFSESHQKEALRAGADKSITELLSASDAEITGEVRSRDGVREQIPAVSEK